MMILTCVITTVVTTVMGGCAGDDEAAEGEGIEVPSTYRFPSRFGDGDSVSRSGQLFRHLLIDRLKAHIAGLTDRIDDGSFIPAEGDVVAELNFYYRFDSEVAGDLKHGMVTDPPARQSAWNDVSSGKDLVSKIAGADPVGQHAQWATDFVGWTEDGVTTPGSLVERWFAQVEALAVARSEGTQGVAPGGGPLSVAHLSPAGVDYKQLIQKLLLGAVAFSQGTDDYLDDSEPDKGLNEQNGEPDKEGASYTSLEHAWDEAFGYFGAALDYGAYSDDEAAGKGGREDWSHGLHDSDGDGLVDLNSEINWGHAVNAAKRDRGSASGATTDFTEGAWRAFLEGRTVITNAGAELTDAERTTLVEARDRAVDNWERAIGATVVHYLNEVVADMDSAGTDDYSFVDHAKHWSELKGFALALQFNPRSAVDAERFAALHDHLGQAPRLAADADFPLYREALMTARALLADAYGFDPANVDAW